MDRFQHRTGVSLVEEKKGVYHEDRSTLPVTSVRSARLGNHSKSWQEFVGKARRTVTTAGVWRFDFRDADATSPPYAEWRWMAM